MREIISVHIGQAGIQVGNACWELYCLEHGIQPDGRMASEIGDDAFTNFFGETGDGRFVPRAVFVDSESTVNDEVRTGSYRRIFGAEQFISENNGPAITYARGWDIFRHNETDVAWNGFDRIRLLAERCDNVQGFLVFNAVGGGTGSGSGSSILEDLSLTYSPKQLIGIPIYPGPQVPSSQVEPFNTVLATRYLAAYADVCLILENGAIYDIGRNSLKKRPSYTNLNRVISQVISSFTKDLRSGRAVEARLSNLRDTFVPKRYMKFVVSSYVPVLSSEQADKQLSATAITNAAFKPAAMMAKCDPTRGKYMACRLIYKGIANQSDVDAATDSLKANKTLLPSMFVTGVSTTFNCEIYQQSQNVVPGGEWAKVKSSICMLANTTSVADVFARATNQFKLMRNKRQFLDLYDKDGIDEDDLDRAEEVMKHLQGDYLMNMM